MRVRAFGLELSLTRAAPLSPAYQGGRGSWYPLIHEPFTGAWQQNREWRADTVLAHNAVYACINRISQDVGKLRPRLLEQKDDGVWRELRNSAHSPVLRRPNHYQNHIQFKEWWTTSKLIHGNAYILLERAAGVIRAMYVLDPTKVQVMVGADGEVFYELSQDNLGNTGAIVGVPASEIIHDRMNCLFHPLVGTSPLFAAGAAANLGLQIEGNATSFFAKGSNISGVLSTVAPLSKDKALLYKELWDAQYTGLKSGGVAVLADGFKFEPMRMSNVEAQVIEHLGWTAEVVCRTFGVPAFKIGLGQQPTYQNGEILNQIYYSDCLQSHIESWELSMDGAFGFETRTGSHQYGVDLDLDGLIRMDSGAQIDSLVKASGGAVMTPDEARRKVNLPPIEGGNALYKQQQDFSLAALAERDRDKPFAKPPPPPPPPPPPNEEDARAAAKLLADVAEVQTMTLQIEGT